MNPKKKLLSLIFIGFLTLSSSSLVYAQETTTNKTTDNSIIAKFLSFLPEGSRIRNFLEETLGVYSESITDIGGENKENSDASANTKKSTISVFDNNKLKEKLGATSKEDEAFADELMGITGKIKKGMSPEEGYALIDSIMKKIPENSNAHNLLSEYVNAFKTQQKSLENIDVEVHKQSK